MASVGITLCWFDLVAVALIFVGVFHGRKNGMSQELFNTMKWLALLTLCPMLYHPVGRLLLKFIPIKAMYGYIAGYVIVGAVLATILVTVRKKVKDKMSGSDVFGRAEFPLGMLAGAFQYMCILTMGIALFNAKYLDEEALKRQEKLQRDAMGEKFFPTTGSLHKDVLHTSIAGQTVRKYLANQMVQPVDAPDRK